jgi:hypothetical protein
MGKMNYEHCMQCGEKLRGATRVRTRPKKCYKCLGQAIPSNNYELQKICKEILNTPTIPGEDELIFEDDPAAVNEIEYGKVHKKPMGVVYTATSLGDTIKNEG